MKIKVRGSADEIETLAIALRECAEHGNYVRSVEVSQVYKANPAHKTGWAWITVIFASTVTSNATIEIFQRRPRRSKGQPRSKAGYVYLLRAIDGSYKIGKTVNPKSRKRTFDVKLPMRVEYAHLIQTDDMHRLERALHQKFAPKRMRGSEFFALDSEDVQFIVSLGDTFTCQAMALHGLAEEQSTRVSDPKKT